MINRNQKSCPSSKQLKDDAARRLYFSLLMATVNHNHRATCDIVGNIEVNCDVSTSGHCSGNGQLALVGECRKGRPTHNIEKGLPNEACRPCTALRVQGQTKQNSKLPRSHVHYRCFSLLRLEPLFAAVPSAVFNYNRYQNMFCYHESSGCYCCSFCCHPTCC